jgi:CRP/FNR family cyclic AMP-dependent transcriptional regulator
MSEEYAELITSFPLFNGFTANGAKRLLADGEVIEHERGNGLMAEGDNSDFVVLVLTGKLEVFVERDGEGFVLMEAGPGTILGELAMLCGIPRSASVRAKEASTVVQWSDEAFRTMLLRDPSLSQRVFREALRTLVEKERSLIDAVIDARDEAHKSYSSES